MRPEFALVTGASGFVGRHLCPELERIGWRVRACYSRNGPPAESVGQSIEWRKMNPMGSSTDWSRLLDGGITTVIHLAALAHRIGVNEQPTSLEYDEINHKATARLAAQAAACPTIRRFLFVSSIGAVASMSDQRIDETSACRPDTPYGLSKLAAEKAVRRELSPSAVHWCILRPPLLYGRGNPGNMERLLALIDLGLPLPFGSIENRRSFLYIGNFIDSIKLGLTHSSAANQLFCIADSEELSTPALIRGLGEAKQKKVHLFRFPVGALRALGHAGTVFERVLGRSLGINTATVDKLCGSLAIDSSFFRSTCGWRPPFSLQDGLRETVANQIRP